MISNQAFSLGGIAIIEKAEKDFGVFKTLFEGFEDDYKDFTAQVKFHVYNKLTHSVAVDQLLDIYPTECFHQLGMMEIPSERTFNRTLERIGSNFAIILERYQQLIGRYNFVDKDQIIDFSSTYFEGKQSELCKFGYSRDKRPDKPQINFGIATGINTIPTAITIQKGNTQDKKHMQEMLKIIPRVIPENSLLIFDCGGNTNENKKKIRSSNYHYLTLRPKKVRTYKKDIAYFNEQLNLGNVESFAINELHYHVAKKKEDYETLYIFFSEELYETEINEKQRKFEREKTKGNKLLKARKHRMIPSDDGWVRLIPHLQKTLFEIDNPYINGIEGFFTLECSVDDEPKKILKLYKEKDKAEKFIRSMKEGLELRPIRHWNDWSIIGAFFIVFLANFLLNLTQLLSKNSVNKNVKVLKKSLINLTQTIVYPKIGFRFTILSNVSDQILSILGDFVYKYEDKTLNLRW